MTRSLLPTFVVLAIALATAACIGRLGRGPSSAGGGTARTAELATLSVHNESDSELVIAYQAAAREAPEVVVGKVGPDSQGEMAPVPAGEPILLAATRADGSALRLQARTFEPDEEWLWVIPADARFQRGAMSQ